MLHQEQTRVDRQAGGMAHHDAAPGASCLQGPPGRRRPCEDGLSSAGLVPQRSPLFHLAGWPS